jgi:hypothetical protein
VDGKKIGLTLAESLCEFVVAALRPNFEALKKEILS